MNTEWQARLVGAFLAMVLVMGCVQQPEANVEITDLSIGLLTITEDQNLKITSRFNVETDREVRLIGRIEFFTEFGSHRDFKFLDDNFVIEDEFVKLVIVEKEYSIPSTKLGIPPVPSLEDITAVKVTIWQDDNDIMTGKKLAEQIQPIRVRCLTPNDATCITRQFGVDGAAEKYS